MSLDVDALREMARGGVVARLGIELVGLRDGAFVTRLVVTPDHLAPHGWLHAGVVVTLADTACGFGCLLSLPEGRTSFTTVELKTNLLGTAREGEIVASARLLHGGRTTQVWDAEVHRAADDVRIAAFRCTQLLLA
jgi:uncharacterized protein (TIGR00369 family)